MFTLPKLDYTYDGLEPFFDAQTMEIHHIKHHQTYVDRLNAILEENTDLKDKSLEELCLDPRTKNMAGGHYNHSFWWKIIGPKTNSETPQAIFNLKTEFNDKAAKLFGSGWVWIVKDKEELKVIQTPLQESPLTVDYSPVVGIDL